MIRVVNKTKDNERVERTISNRIRTPFGVTPSCVYIKIQLNFYNGRAWGRKPGAELKAVVEKWPSKEVLSV